MLPYRIQLPMRLLRSLLLLLTLAASSAFAGSITGVFQGTVVQVPAAKSQAQGSSKSAPRWMYVQGKNGSIRRANIAKAVIEYDEDYPQAKRHKQPAESLIKAAVVRVTAQQDQAKDGEWQATNVLIVAPPDPSNPETKPARPIPTLAKR